MPRSVYQHHFARAVAQLGRGTHAAWATSSAESQSSWETILQPAPGSESRLGVWCGAVIIAVAISTWWPSAFSPPSWPPEFKALSPELRCWPCLSPTDPFSPLLTRLSVTQGWSLLLGAHHTTTSQKTESLAPIPPVSSSLPACPSLAVLLGC